MHLWWPLLVAPAAAVYVGWPMSEQLPDVARIGEAYLFTLASSTYKSSAGGSIAYSASGLPSWLLFDSLSRAFLGTPAAADVGDFDIALSGVDSADGSNYTADYSMVVSNSSGLSLASPDVMFTQISQYGYTNGADGLVVSQGEDFALQFSESVFRLNDNASRPIVAYYGRSEDRTSLPSWVSFDADLLTFSGLVPYVTSEIAPSLEYAFSFIASDYTGHAGAEGVFKLVVGAHLLGTSLNETTKINGTIGADFEYTVPVLTAVFLDDELITRSNILAVEALGMPNYVSFDDDTFVLSGTFPNALLVQNFSVQVLDVYGDSVLLPYNFDAVDSVFTVDSIADVNATRGEYFELQLLRSYFTEYDETTIDVLIANGSWLEYTSANMTIQGTAPVDFDAVDVTVYASSDFGDGLRSFQVVGVDAVSALSSSSAASSATSSASPTLAASAVPSASASSSSLALVSLSKSSDSHEKLVLGLAIGLPLLAVLVGLLLFIFCCCRRKKSDDNESSATDTEDITGPGFGHINSNNDHNETAVQLSALNALKLDDDNRSTLSSVTHVDSDGDFFLDAQEKPAMSWRANDQNDSAAMKKKLLQERHASALSLSTVATEQLFSVRLVDDNSAHNSSLSLGFFNRKSTDVDGLMRGNSSGNIQRLDSDGNIVQGDRPDSNNSIDDSHTKGHQGLINILEEVSNLTDTPDSSDYNLLDKFLGHDSEVSSLQEPSRALYNHEAPSVDGTLLPSPDTDEFFSKGEDTQKGGPYPNGNVLSRSSVYSGLSFKGGEKSGLGGDKAQLVEFTRKASLRDSACQQHVDHAADKAQIYDDSD